jgi:Dockerin type I domain
MPVNFASTPTAAFSLVRTGGGAVSFSATANLINGRTVVTLSNFSGNETQFGSLADGRYTLTAIASQSSANTQPLDGNSDGLGGDNYVFNDSQGLFRLFGDINGDQTVNGLDFGYFRDAFGTQTGDANFLSYIDFNGDGVINGFDFGQFKTRFGTMLP